MRVAFFLNSFPEISETFILNQVTGLIDRGHAIDIYAFNQNTLQLAHPNIQKYKLLKRTFFIDVIPRTPWAFTKTAIFMMVRCFPWLPIRVSIAIKKALFFNHQAKMHYSAARALIMIPKNNLYDIIHCQFGVLGPVVLSLKKMGAIHGKLVTSFRGYDATRVIEENPSFYDELFEKGDLFLPVSESLKKKIVESGCKPEKICIHRSGIDFTKFTPGGPHARKDKAIKLLTIGRLVEKKGISYAIQAVFELRRCDHRVNYTVIGEGYLRPALEKLIEDLDLFDEVKLIGGQNPDAVVQYLKQSHIVIAPSVTANGDQEGIPNALKEAMGMGLPVVATRHGGIPELIEDGVSGFLVPERDVEALVDRLVFLIKHPEGWQELGRRGSKTVRENYDINMLNEKLIGHYQDILKQSSLN